MKKWFVKKSMTFGKMGILRYEKEFVVNTFLFASLIDGECQIVKFIKL